MTEETIETSADFLKAVTQRIADQNKRPPNKVFSLFLVYKYVKKNRNMDAVLNDKRWDRINFDRSSKWCRELLECYEGDINRASDAIIEIGTRMEKMSCLWDLATVHKRLTDWEEGRLDRN